MFVSSLCCSRIASSRPQRYNGNNVEFPSPPCIQVERLRAQRAFHKTQTDGGRSICESDLTAMQSVSGGCCYVLYAITCLSFLAVLVLLLLKIYAIVTLGVCTSKAKMNGKTVLITGANSGIGKETALELAKRGARVILACRNLETGNKARDDIIEKSGNQNVVLRQLDLSSLESIRRFANEITSTETRLDVLINNAGMANMFSRKTTSDGLEITVATNHLGPFLLTLLLIDLLKRSAPSRVVVVASELYRLSRLNLNNVNPVNGFPAYLYYVSKLMNIHFTLELARRLEGSGVTANCLHPGMINSGIWRNVPFPLNLPLKLITKGFFKTPEQGAQTSIYLAVSDEVTGITGKYFMDCKEHGLNARASDSAVAKKLWEQSEELVKLEPNDPHL